MQDKLPAPVAICSMLNKWRAQLLEGEFCDLHSHSLLGIGLFKSYVFMLFSKPPCAGDSWAWACIWKESVCLTDRKWHGWVDYSKDLDIYILLLCPAYLHRGWRDSVVCEVPVCYGGIMLRPGKVGSQKSFLKHEDIWVVIVLFHHWAEMCHKSLVHMQIILCWIVTIYNYL